MPSPLANIAGNANLSVTATATGARLGSTAQFIDVALGKPVIEALADIANAFHLRKTALTDTNGRYAVRLRTGSPLADLSLELTFHQNGINEGDAIVLADA